MISEEIRASMLSPFANAVLISFESRFPSLLRDVRVSDLDNLAWIADIPCPEGTRPEWSHFILSVRTHGFGPESLYGEEVRIDWGNWHTHFGCYEEPRNLKFLDRTFGFLEDILNDRLVLRSVVLKSGEHIQTVLKPEDPLESEPWHHDVERIEQWSWNGRHVRLWPRGET